MKKQFSEYLASIGIEDLFYQRVEEFYALYSNLLDEEILDLFVTDYVDAEGRRLYQNLWFFTEAYLAEVFDFLTNDKFDLVPLKKRVMRWQITKQDYDFKKATTKSRMHLQVQMAPGESECNMKASRENCDYLRSIFLKYFMPNVATI